MYIRVTQKSYIGRNQGPCPRTELQNMYLAMRGVTNYVSEPKRRMSWTTDLKNVLYNLASAPSCYRISDIFNYFLFAFLKLVATADQSSVDMRRRLR